MATPSRGAHPPERGGRDNLLTHSAGARACVRFSLRAVASLLCEVQELYNTIRQLKDTLHESELTMSRMVKMRSQLLHDIAVKENTLQIDQRCCIGRRRFMPMDPGVGPIVALEPCADPCT